MRTPRQLYINPPEYGVRLWSAEEIKLMTSALRRADGFRFNSTRSFAEEAEQKIGLRLGDKECVLTSNGTAALQAALYAVGVRAGGRVLVSALTYHATSNAVLRLGASPIPIDIDLRFGISLGELDGQLNALPQPSAVVVVHWPGHAFDISPVVELCHQHGVPIVEDACQAFFAKSTSAFAGVSGDVGVFSFQQNKLITSGEGGCLITSSKAISTLASQFIDQGVRRSHGQPISSISVISGADNLRITGIQAAILCAQIQKLDGILEMLEQTRDLFIRMCKSRELPVWGGAFREGLGQALGFLFQTRAAADYGYKEAKAKGIILRPIWPRPFFEVYEEGAVCDRECYLARQVVHRVRIMPLPLKLNEKNIVRLVEFLAERADDLFESHGDL